MKPGDKVRCIRAPEHSIPIKEDETYTVEWCFVGNPNPAEACAPGMEQTPGVSLVGVYGYFTADRFEVI